jgi:large repetitive protein
MWMALVGVGITVVLAGCTLGSQSRVHDSFDAELASGWGAAEIGGEYRLIGPRSDFGVHGGWGVMVIREAALTRAAYVDAVALGNATVMISFRTDRVPAGGNEYIAIAVRGSGDDTEYLAKLWFSPDRRTWVQATRLIDGQEAPVSAQASVDGVAYDVSKSYSLRARVSGVRPTTVQIKAWSGGAEPSSWTVTGADSDDHLQGPGRVGIRCHLGHGSSNGPVEFQVDELLVTD